MKFVKLVSAVVVLTFTSGVNAALITENFSATVIDGEFAGAVGSGFFSYNDDFIPGAGAEQLNSVDGLTIEFNVFDQLFTGQDDIEYPEFPVLSFLDGNVTALDYLVSENLVLDQGVYVGHVLTDIDRAGVYNFFIGSVIASSEGGYEGVLSVNEVESLFPVPLPAAAWLFITGLLSLAGLSRRKKI